MKRDNIIMALLVTSIGAGVFAAGSLEARPGNRGGERPTFETLDTDGDGMITQAEIDARWEERFQAFDPDGDGSVTLEEFKANMAAQAEERAERMFTQLDSDGDGMLTRDVLELRQGRTGRIGNFIERLDADGDGAISAEEFAELENRRGLRRGGRDGRGGQRGE